MADSRIGHASGLKIEAGNKPFVTTGVTLAVSTALEWVTAAIGQTTTGLLVCSAPVGRVTSGSVTFTRSSGTASADILNYVLMGY